MNARKAVPPRWTATLTWQTTKGVRKKAKLTARLLLPLLAQIQAFVVTHAANHPECPVTLNIDTTM